MPPEQFGDRATPASDLYALGSTLIYLATGKHPADLPQIDQRIQFENEAHLSLWLEQWLRKIVQPSLNQRFTSAQTALTTLKKRTYVSEALISQPDNSKAILKKKSNLLEIFLPSRAQTANLASLIVIISISQVLIFINLIFLSIIVRVIMAVIASPSFTQFINYIFFIVIGWVFFLVPLVLISMFFWSIRLRISRQDIRQDWVLFGLKILSIKKTDVSKINKLELNSRTKVKRSQGLWIRTDKQDFCLTASGQTEAELEWLAQELSLWLKQPIMRE
jgi:serine/threonine protein kinase